MNSKLTIGFVLIASSLFGANSSFALPRVDFIIGGKKVTKQDAIASSTVALLNGDALCTASLISESLVVTAAHCVGPDREKMAIVFKGSLKGKLPAAQVLGYVVPKSYQGEESLGKNQDDIALVYFEGKLPSGFAPAEILPASKSLRDGDRVILAGYGISAAHSQKGAGTLRKVEVQIQDAEYAKTEVLLDQSQGKGACHGDSGGPAFVEEGGQIYLWGVTSRGAPESAPDDCAHESVYTVIRAHSDFLRQAAAELDRGIKSLWSADLEDNLEIDSSAFSRL